MSDLLDFFVKTLGEQIHLTAIHPDSERPTIGRDFGTAVSVAGDWANVQSASGMNVYYSVNLVRPGLNKKPSKADIARIRFAHIDIDPPKNTPAWAVDQREAAYESILSSAIRPSIVVWSGNGWQALWRLEGDVTHDQVEDVNRSLIAKLGGDKGTHNADRLLRVPGLINYPNKLKRSWGRTAQDSHIVLEDDGTCHPISALQNAPPAPATKSETQPPSEVHCELSGAGVLLTANDLGLMPGSYLRKLIDAPKGVDRSDDVFHFACEGLRYGLTSDQVTGVLLNSANAISSHCLDQKDPERAARRAIDTALMQEDVRALARKYDKERERVLAAGDCNEPSDGTKIWTLEDMLRDCVFIEEGAFVADTTRRGYVLCQSDFRASTAASKMKVEVPNKQGVPRPVSKQISEVWLAHPERRSVATQTFRPGQPEITHSPNGRIALNTWSGFAFSPPPVDWEMHAEPFVTHVQWLWGADAEAFLDWLAHIAQRPGELPSVAWLHIAKRTGMGRNWVAAILGRVFTGYAALAFDLSGSLKNGYNGLLAGKVLAVVDEIDEGSGGRKYQVQQELKQLVTEETRTVNPKYGRQHTEWNVCRWLIFSNSATALPLEDDDRRFWVVQCEEMPKDASYYKTLYQLRDDPAFIASVAKSLLERDLAGFNQGQRAPLSQAKAALLERTRSDEDNILQGIAERWPVDLITNDELHELLGDHRPTAGALRHALNRQGIIRLKQGWKKAACGYETRKNVTVYSIRNHLEWANASITALRAELGRLSTHSKEAALYGE